MNMWQSLYPGKKYPYGYKIIFFKLVYAKRIHRTHMEKSAFYKVTASAYCRYCISMVHLCPPGCYYCLTLLFQLRIYFIFPVTIVISFQVQAGAGFYDTTAVHGVGRLAYLAKRHPA